MSSRDVPSRVLARKPGNLFILATDRETNAIVLCDQFEPVLSEGSTFWRKWSYGWWDSRYWEYRRWNKSDWEARKKANESPYLKDIREIKAKTIEEAHIEYAKAGNH